MWVIVKIIKNLNGVELPVIILDSQNEIWEFESIESAEKMRTVFEANSDSGHKYIVKKL